MSATVYSSDRTGLLIIDPYNDFANGGIDRERWRKLNPELSKRLLEICPTKTREE